MFLAQGRRIYPKDFPALVNLQRSLSNHTHNFESTTHDPRLPQMRFAVITILRTHTLQAGVLYMV